MSIHESPGTLARKDREKYQHSSNGSGGGSPQPHHVEQDLMNLQYFSVLPSAANYQQIQAKNMQMNSSPKGKKYVNTQDSLMSSTAM